MRGPLRDGVTGRRRGEGLSWSPGAPPVVLDFDERLVGCFLCELGGSPCLGWSVGLRAVHGTLPYKVVGTHPPWSLEVGVLQLFNCLLEVYLIYKNPMCQMYGAGRVSRSHQRRQDNRCTYHSHQLPCVRVCDKNALIPSISKTFKKKKRFGEDENLRATLLPTFLSAPHHVVSCRHRVVGHISSMYSSYRNEILYPLTNMTLISLSSTPGNHHSTL